MEIKEIRKVLDSRGKYEGEVLTRTEVLRWLKEGETAEHANELAEAFLREKGEKDKFIRAAIMLKQESEREISWYKDRVKQLREELENGKKNVP